MEEYREKILIFMLKHDMIRNLFLLIMSVPISLLYGLRGFFLNFFEIWKNTCESIMDNEQGLKRMYKIDK